MSQLINDLTDCLTRCGGLNTQGSVPNTIHPGWHYSIDARARTSFYLSPDLSHAWNTSPRATSQYIRFTAGKREYLLQPLLPHTPNSTIFQFSKESICVLSNFLFYFVISIDENNPIISYDANMGEAADGETWEDGG